MVVITINNHANVTSKLEAPQLGVVHCRTMAQTVDTSDVTAFDRRTFCPKKQHKFKSIQLLRLALRPEVPMRAREKAPDRREKMAR